MFSQLLKISYDNVLVKNRGFQVKENRVKDILEQIGETFLDGYHAVVEDPVNFTNKLEVFPSEFKGFAYEGAGMALKLLDFFILIKEDSKISPNMRELPIHICFMLERAGVMLSFLCFPKEIFKNNIQFINGSL